MNNRKLNNKDLENVSGGDLTVEDLTILNYWNQGVYCKRVKHLTLEETLEKFEDYPEMKEYIKNNWQYM